MIANEQIPQLVGLSVASLLVLARLLGLVFAAPAFGSVLIGWRIRLLLALLLTLLIAPIVGSSAPILPSIHGIDLIARLVVEAAIGAGMGLAAGLVIAGARQAGELVGNQAGLAPSSIFDPELSDEPNPFGHLYGQVSLAVFLVFDGPLALVGSLIESYRALPIGETAATSTAADWLFARVGWALLLSVQFAAPVAVALVLAGVALGLLGRAAPSLPLLALALPMRAVLGMIIALLGLVSLTLLVESALRTMI